MRGVGDSLLDLVKPIAKWMFQNVFKEYPVLVIVGMVVLVIVVYFRDLTRER